MTDFVTAFRQESTQVFVASVAALGTAWKIGMPDFLLWIIGGLGALLILTEKVRAMVRPRSTDGNHD